MTVAPARYCTVPTCPNRTTNGRCPAHAVQKERARGNYEWRKLYRQEKWKATRRCVLSEEPFCADCLKQGFWEPSEDVHHKARPLNETMFYDRENLQGLCHSCHSTRTARGE